MAVTAVDVHRALVIDWHTNACGCEKITTDTDGDLVTCASREQGYSMHNPLSWTVDEVLDTLRALEEDGQ
jgi:hypothetical protein